MICELLERPDNRTFFSDRHVIQLHVDSEIPHKDVERPFLFVPQLLRGA